MLLDEYDGEDKVGRVKLRIDLGPNLFWLEAWRQDVAQYATLPWTEMRLG